MPPKLRIHLTIVLIAVCAGWASPAPAECDLKDGEVTAPLGAESTPAKEQLQGDVFFINGVATPPDRAIEQAKRTGDMLRTPTRLVYNDLTLDGVDDIAIAWDKLFDASVSLNAATDALIEQIKVSVEAGREVYIVGFSAGAIITNNAVREVADDYDERPVAEQQRLLGRIHVLLVGGAVFSDDHPLSDGWPEYLGSHFQLYDKRDEISQVFGAADWDDADEAAHSYLGNYVGHICRERLQRNGTLEIHGQ